MAGPHTHIVFAKRFVRTKPEIDEEAFIVGTSLPDIRYLAKLNRNQTHSKSVSLAAVRDSPDSFEAGYLFHSYVDVVRQKLVHSKIDHEAFPVPSIAPTALKILEDAYFAGEIDEWKSIANYFTKILPDEVKTGITLENLRSWHHTISEYISSGDVSGLDEFLEALHFSKDDKAGLYQNIQYAHEQAILDRYISGLSALF